MKAHTVDRILGVSAILISLLTLIMFIYQTNLMHKQSRLSVMPRLGFTTAYDHNDSVVVYSALIKNKGIGPAIINSAKIILEGKEYKLDMEDFFDEAFPKLDEYGNFNRLSNLGEGNTLAAGEIKKLFSYEFLITDIEKISAYMQLEDEDTFPFNMEVEYSSIYDEKWRIDIQKGGYPIKLE